MLEKTLTQEQLDEIYKELPHDLHCDTEWKDRILGKKVDQADVYLFLLNECCFLFEFLFLQESAE